MRLSVCTVGAGSLRAFLGMDRTKVDGQPTKSPSDPFRVVLARSPLRVADLCPPTPPRRRLAHIRLEAGEAVEDFRRSSLKTAGPSHFLDIALELLSLSWKDDDHKFERPHRP